MKEGEQQKFKFNDKPLSISEKKSFADYTPEQKRHYEQLLLEAYTSHQNLTPELRHYQNLKQIEELNN